MKNYGIVSKNENFVLQRVAEGASAYKIAKELGCTKSSVLKYLHKQGLTTKCASKVDRNNLLKDKLSEVIKMYQDGKSCNEIGTIIGHSGGQIGKLLKNAGVDVQHAQYSVDEHYFDTIDTENKAYILGWCYSDGTVDDTGRLRIQLQIDDIDILSQIQDELKYNGPLHHVPPPKRFPHRKTQVCLCISRVHMVNMLKTYGCMPNKSLILTFPVWLDDNLFKHFIRGYFDGDGSVHKRTGIVSITSTDMFNNELNQRLKKLLGLESGKLYYRYEDKNSCSLTFNKKDSVKFLRWIYSECSMLLRRKFRTAEPFINKGNFDG